MYLPDRKLALEMVKIEKTHPPFLFSTSGPTAIRSEFPECKGLLILCDEYLYSVTNIKIAFSFVISTASLLRTR